MPASRITFAIGDFTAEVRRLVPEVEQPLIDVRFDFMTWLAVVSEIESHYHGVLERECTAGDMAVRFAGVRFITALPKKPKRSANGGPGRSRAAKGKPRGATIESPAGG